MYRVFIQISVTKTGDNLDGAWNGDSFKISSFKNPHIGSCGRQYLFFTKNKKTTKNLLFWIEVQILHFDSWKII